MKVRVLLSPPCGLMGPLMLPQSVLSPRSKIMSKRMEGKVVFAPGYGSVKDCRLQKQSDDAARAWAICL